MPHRKTRFAVRDVYKRKHAHAFRFAGQRYSFWIATFSLFAFVVGNMVGQHGFYAFWHSVLGKEEDAGVIFTGTIPPIDLVPDYVKWAQYGGDIKDHTYRMVPKDVLIPLPKYVRSEQTKDYEHAAPGDVYSIGHMGSYETGAENDGSHVGTDIRVPVGTPVRSIANGIVEQVKSISGGYGNYIVIRHPNIPDTTDRAQRKLKTMHSIYAHLDTMIVTEGMVVNKGEQIGTSGQSGFATGPHLHFQIDNEMAPFHPYWPFSTSEMNNAQLTFVGAINRGLNKENGRLYTENPMEIVYKYESFAVRVATTATVGTDTLATSSIAMTQEERVARRRVQRLNRAGVGGGVQSSANNGTSFGEPGASHSSGTASSVSSASSAASSVSSFASSSEQAVIEQPAVDTSAPVAHIDIRHDGTYRRNWETMQVEARDANGQLITHAKFDGKMYLRAGFGDAEIRPTTLTASDFKNGIATIHVLPFTRKKTFIIETFGAFSVQAEPMVYEQND